MPEVNLIWDDFEIDIPKVNVVLPAKEKEEVKVDNAVPLISNTEYLKELILICGVPGSGKSTLAKYLKSAFGIGFNVSCVCLEADKFFTDPRTNKYKFNPEKLQEAHEWCQGEVRKSMAGGIIKVIVSNTSINKRQREPYYKLAKEYGYLVQTIICRGEFGSIHEVPAETIRRMSRAFEF